MPTTEISWGDGTGDKLYFTADAMSGNQTVQVSSDVNAGDTDRTKIVNFQASGVSPQPLQVIQLRGGTSGGPIPSGYTPVRYVQTDSVAYIDTGVSGNNNNLVIEMFFEITNYVQYGYMFGNYTNENANSTRAILTGANNIAFNYNNKSSSSSAKTYIRGEKLYLKLYAGNCVWSGAISTVSTVAGTANSGNILLGKGASNQPKRDLGLKIYRFIMTDDGTIIRDYLPAKRVSDDAVGLYDVINDTFNPSASSTPFVAGPEV